MRHFFSVYKALENKQTAVDEVRNAEEALKIISECIERYNVGFCGKKPAKPLE